MQCSCLLPPRRKPQPYSALLPTWPQLPAPPGPARPGPEQARKLPRAGACPAAGPWAGRRTCPSAARTAAARSTPAGGPPWRRPRCAARGGRAGRRRAGMRRRQAATKWQQQGPRLKAAQEPAPLLPELRAQSRAERTARPPRLGAPTHRAQLGVLLAVGQAVGGLDVAGQAARRDGARHLRRAGEPPREQRGKAGERSGRAGTRLCCMCMAFCCCSPSATT